MKCVREEPGHEKNSDKREVLASMYDYRHCVFFTNSLFLVPRNSSYRTCCCVLYLAISSKSTANEKLHSKRKKHACCGGSLYPCSISKELRATIRQHPRFVQYARLVRSFSPVPVRSARQNRRAGAAQNWCSLSGSRVCAAYQAGWRSVPSSGVR